MKNVSFGQLTDTLRRFSAELSGVFTFSDLWNLLGKDSSDRTAKAIDRLLREDLLQKVRRGIYITRDASLWVLASRLKPRSYISLDSVLANEGLIGSVPTRSVSAIYPGKAETIATPIGRVRYFQIKKDLMFGFETKKNGIHVADKEKAFIDLLYYGAKGAAFVADPLKDVDVEKLDRQRFRKYLKHYKNPKFRKYAEGALLER